MRPRWSASPEVPPPWQLANPLGLCVWLENNNQGERAEGQGRGEPEGEKKAGVGWEMQEDEAWAKGTDQEALWPKVVISGVERRMCPHPEDSANPWTTRTQSWAGWDVPSEGWLEEEQGFQSELLHGDHQWSGPAEVHWPECWGASQERIHPGGKENTASGLHPYRTRNLEIKPQRGIPRVQGSIVLVRHFSNRHHYRRGPRYSSWCGNRT